MGHVHKPMVFIGGEAHLLDNCGGSKRGLISIPKLKPSLPPL